MSVKEKLRFLLHVIIPAACCIILGYIIYGNAIFMPKMTTFQIIITGLMGSLFLASLKVTAFKNSVGILLIIFVLNSFFITKSIQAQNLFADIVYYAALFLSIYFFYTKFYMKKSPSFYSLYMTLSFALIYSIGLIAYFAARNFNFGVPLSSGFRIVFIQILINVLIGLGIGTGTFFADKYLPLQKIIPDEAYGEKTEMNKIYYFL